MCRRLQTIGIMLALICCAQALFASGEQADTPHPDVLWHALDGIHFDLRQTYVVRDLVVRRYGVTLNFDRGRIVFLEPVDGVVTGLLFWGKGTVVVIPPNKIERQQLSLFTGSPTLSERFSEAFVRFTDDTYSELMAQIEAASGLEPIEQSTQLEHFGEMLKREVLTNCRVLKDLLEGRKWPMFVAKILSQRLGVFDIDCDPRKTEDVFLGQFQQIGDQSFYDTWCSFSSPEQSRSDISPDLHGSAIDIRQYLINVTIDKSDRLTATSEIEFQCKEDGVWVLTLDLSRFLKVSQIFGSQGQILRFFQNSDLTSEELSKIGHDVVVVLFDKPTRQGEIRKLRFNYSGDVISRVGTGVFYVGSRGSWYPNLGLTDRACYELRFSHPKSFTVVATGNLIRTWDEQDQRHSIWNSGTEIPVAGFNYGDYVQTIAQAGNVRVEVYANRGIESVYQEVMARLEYLRQLQRQQAITSGRPTGLPAIDTFAAGPNFLDFDTTRFAKEIAERVVETLGTFEPLLGIYPYKRLAVSQIPGRFSQGWPSLLYASSLSFLSPAQRERLGMKRDRGAHFLECLHAHEIAHQWWGNYLGWKSYRDQWMIEGFSTYLGYLSMKSRYPEGRQFDDLMRFSRERLQQKNEGGQTLESAGPVVLGARLNSSKFPGAYNAVAYEKGAWILHMLRYLFSEPETGSDEQFRKFMKEFVSIHGGQLISTEDFQKATEKYTTKPIDLEGNKRLDWFFDQWVYETGIPTYRLEYSLRPANRGEYLLKGKIKQEGVSEYFLMPVDLFAHFSPDRSTRLGRVVVSGSETSFQFSIPQKPLKVILDENLQILCNNKTL